jgi:tetratricopeptide (TPR) repeat protein
MVLDHLFDLHRPLAVPSSILLDASGRVAAVYRGRVAIDQLLDDVRLVTDSPEQFASSHRFAGRRYIKRKRLSPFDLAWKLVEQAPLDDAIEYIEQNKQLLKDHFNLHKLLVLVGNGRLARGEADHAAALYGEALKIDVDYVDAQNNLAWLLATHADEEIRDEKKAVRYAEMAVSTAGNVPSLLDTLAAAYAADGRFDDAVKSAKKAIEVATVQAQPQLARNIELRLRLYKAGQPYRENPSLP